MGTDGSAALRLAAPPIADAIRRAAKARVKAGLLRLPPKHVRIGRYVIGEKLGQGSMGAVYRARDPHLKRDVALKLYCASRHEARSRCLSEGRALARLTHPHVVRVFDVGQAGDDVFLSMELVRGTTLRHWLRVEHRSRHDIVAAFVAAGRGLAAAHAAGVIHRDFKPDNVLLDPHGADRIARFGRVVVVDFGLAWHEDPVARTREAAGTFGYAAPEQIEGRPVAASDQFALCVALTEAVTGRRPGPNARVRHGLPRRLARTLERGLRADPQQRHASMDALVADLERFADMRRGLWPATLAIGALSLVATGFVAEPSPAPSVGRTSVAAPGATSPDVAEARRLLDQGRIAEAEARIAATEGPAAGVVRAEILAEQGRAAEAEAVAAQAAAAAAANGDARLELDAWLVMVRAVGWGQQRHDEALQIGRTAEAILHRLGDPPDLVGRYEAVVGIVLHAAGRYLQAAERLERAAQLQTGRRAGSTLLSLGGTLLRLGRSTEAVDARRRALALLTEALGHTHPDVATAHVALGQALKNAEEYAPAREHYARGIDLLERAHGREHASLAIPLLNYGNLEHWTGNHEQALELHRRYRAIVATSYPEDHPEHGRAAATLADGLLSVGDFPGAVAPAREALRIAENHFGADHFRTAWAGAVLAQAQSGAGEHEAARHAAALALSRAEQVWGTDSPKLLDYLLVAASIAKNADDLVAARPLYQRAAELAQRHGATEALADARRGLEMPAPLTRSGAAAG